MAYEDPQAAAEQKYGSQRVQDWLAKNPGDLSRIDSAFQSDNISKTNTPGEYTGGFANSPWSGGGAPTGTWGTSSYSSSTGSRTPGTGGVDPFPTPTYQNFSSQAPTNYSGTGGVAGPAGTPPSGGLTREQVIQMVDNLKTEGIKGASGFDLYYGVGKTPQQMLDYMNQFGQKAGNSAWSWNASNLAPEFQNWAAAGTGTAPDRRTELYDMMMGRAKQGLGITGEDPIIKGQVDAYRAAQERGRRDLQSNLAESGNSLSTTQNRMAHEKMGQNVGGFQAELIGRELTARRAEIMEYMQSAAGLLSDGDRLALQRELGLLDNEIRKQQLSLQGRGLDLQGQELDLRRQLGLGELDLNRQQLNSQNDRWLNEFGYQTGDRARYWDWLERNG